MRQFAWTFPGARSKIDTIPATAGDANDTYVVPAGKKNRLECVKIILTTNATGANRIVNIQITDGTNLLFQSSAVIVTASSTETLYFAIGFTATGAYMNALPPTLILGAAYEVIIDVIAGVAGDSYEGFAAYSEIDAP